MRGRFKAGYTRARISGRVAQMGRVISRDYNRRTLDLVVILENAFIFGADLARQIACPVVCHFVRVRMRDIQVSGHARREVFFSSPPHLKGRHVLLVDAVLHSGVTQDFLIKRLLDSRPRSLRVAVLLDKPQDRKLNLKPDYFGFVAASKYWVGYGLAGSQGLYRNLPSVGSVGGVSRRAPGSRAKRRHRGGRRARQAR